jgi:ATP-dependent DNA helicase DinG
MSARAQAVADAGGNGFMAVAATHAALRLAQGSGRLVRSTQDRGVVAVLDSRLATARYGGFLRASMPPFWPTADRDKVLGALRRLDASVGEVLPVLEPGLRADAVRDDGVEAVPDLTSVRPVEPAPVPESTRTAVVQGRAWTAEDDQTLREGVDLGCTVEDLADQFECEVDAVLARLAALGMRAPREDELF